MKEVWKRTVYTTCKVLAVAILLGTMIHAFRPSKEIRFNTLHPVSTLQPVMGLSAESILNTGDAVALDVLPGVGEVIAERIIETRAVLGGFCLPEDLMLVKGIGEKTFEKIMEALDEALVPLTE